MWGGGGREGEIDRRGQFARLCQLLKRAGNRHVLCPELTIQQQYQRTIACTGVSGDRDPDLTLVSQPFAAPQIVLQRNIGGTAFINRTPHLLIRRVWQVQWRDPHSASTRPASQRIQRVALRLREFLTPPLAHCLHIGLPGKSLFLTIRNQAVAAAPVSGQGGLPPPDIGIGNRR